MPSLALTAWNSSRKAELDGLYRAHSKIEGGGAPGRRYATKQLNNALVGAVSAQFQGFCRDLHDEASTLLAAKLDPNLRTMFVGAMQKGRKLDRGNPNEGNIGEDFWRFGLDAWHDARFGTKTAKKHRVWLGRLNLWRNAVAHEDFDFSSDALTKLKRAQPWLSDVRACHGACSYAARVLDEVVGDFLAPLLPGGRPW